MFERKRFVIGKLILNYIITLSLPALITLFYTISAFKTFTVALLKTWDCFDKMKSIQVPILILVFIVIPFIVNLFNYKNNDKATSSNEEALFTLLSHIDTVIGAKNKRFYDCIKRIDQNPVLNIFNEITQPVIQITEIIKNITTYFEILTKDSTIKTSLLRMRSDNSLEYFIYLYGQPTTDQAVLNEDGSAAKQCIKEKKIIVINDTHKKGVSFKHSSGCSTKSIICYPIAKGSKIEYVICITSREKNTFLIKEWKKYDYFLEQFSRRIVLESYLDYLKEANNA